MSFDMYQENILDHFENPRNFGEMKVCDIKSHDTNPLCGDSFTFEFKLEGKRIENVKFSGHGCAISTASASMLTEKITGKNIDFVKNLKKEDIIEMLGIKLSPVRIKCAVLPLKIIQLGIYSKNNTKL